MKPSPRTLTPSEELLVAGGLLVQPFLAAVLAFALFPRLLLDRQGQALAGGYPMDPADAAVSVAIGAGIVAGAVTLLGVLPSAVWLVRRRNLTLAETLLLGLGFGNLPYGLMAIAAGGTYGVEGLLRGVAFSSLLGLSGAALFWLIALRSRRRARDQAH
jgi:hypothetical protein